MIYKHVIDFSKLSEIFLNNFSNEFYYFWNIDILGDDSDSATPFGCPQYWFTDDFIYFDDKPEENPSNTALAFLNLMLKTELCNLVKGNKFENYKKEVENICKNLNIVVK